MRGMCLNPASDSPSKLLRPVGVDGRSGRNILSKERDDGFGFEVWNHFHAKTPGAFASLLHCDQDESRTPSFELSASSQTGLLAANPRLINLYVAVQWLPSYIYHRPTELVKHHPYRLVARQAELPLQKQSGYSTLVGSHQIGGPKPVGQRNLSPVEHRSGGQRNLVPTACTLSPSHAGQFVGMSVSASRADETIGPTARSQILLASFFSSKVGLKLTQRFGKRRPRHPDTLSVGSC
jgi:hypothetical protein